MQFSKLFAVALLFPAFASGRAIPSDIDTIPRGFTKVNPRPITEAVVSEESVLKGTYRGHSTVTVPPTGNNMTSSLDMHSGVSVDLQFVNPSHQDVNVYVSGNEPSGAVVFVRQDGNLIKVSSSGSSNPVPLGQDMKIRVGAGETVDMTLSTPLYASRIWYADGEMQFGVVLSSDGEGIQQPVHQDPNDPNAHLSWNFAEFTFTPQGAINADISYADFTSMAASIELSSKDGTTQLVQGVRSGSVDTICKGLGVQEKADGHPWTALCMAGDDGRPVRVLAPLHHPNKTDFSTYWDDYVDEVWSRFANETLTINTQSQPGHVDCRVSGHHLTCEGDNRAYSKPTAIDIWGCAAGPFQEVEGDNGVHRVVIPRLCAAFVRSTLLKDILPPGNPFITPGFGQAYYYQHEITNHYGRLVHECQIDGKGYAFAYDDVNPGGENTAGAVGSEIPDRLTVTFGVKPS